MRLLTPLDAASGFNKIASNQKRTFNASCTTRGAVVVLLIVPKAVVLTFVPGTPKFTVFVRLYISPRIYALTLSPIEIRRATARSRDICAGDRMFRPRPRLPYDIADGTANALSGE